MGRIVVRIRGVSDWDTPPSVATWRATHPEKVCSR